MKDNSQCYQNEGNVWNDMAHFYSAVIQGHSLGILHRDPICFEFTYTRNSDESLTIMGFSSKRMVSF
jgi:hypothetical protein